MKFYLRILFLASLVVLFKVVFDIPVLQEEVSSLQDAIHSKYLIEDGQNLIINMKKVFKTRNPKHVLDRLLQFGGNINGEKANGSTPLIFSVLRGNKDMTKYLLKKGADGEHPLFYFIITRHLKVASLLIKCGVNANAKTQFGSSPLQVAIMMLCKDAIDKIAANGLIPEQKIDTQTIDQTIKLVKLLLLNKANPNAVSQNISVLGIALRASNQEIIKLLLEHGANPNVQSADTNSTTPLIKYTIKNDHQMVKLLLEKGADVNYQDNEGKTALFYVKDKALAEFLIDKCTNINFKGFQGYTALNWAAHQKNEVLVQLLLSQGADATIKNLDGYSALDSVNI